MNHRLRFKLDGKGSSSNVRTPMLRWSNSTGRSAWAAIRKRAKAAGFLTPVGCHTWGATGITIYLENDGRLEHAQQMAGHESPRTTLRPDKERDYTDCGGAHPVVTFDSYVDDCAARSQVVSLG